MEEEGSADVVVLASSLTEVGYSVTIRKAVGELLGLPIIAFIYLFNNAPRYHALLKLLQCFMWQVAHQRHRVRHFAVACDLICVG